MTTKLNLAFLIKIEKLCYNRSNVCLNLWQLGELKTGQEVSKSRVVGRVGYFTLVPSATEPNAFEIQGLGNCQESDSSIALEFGGDVGAVD